MDSAIFMMVAFFVSLQAIMVILNQEGQKKEIKFESGITYHMVPNAPPVPNRDKIFTGNSSFSIFSLK